MDISFPPVWIELKVKVKSIEEMEYLTDCLKDLGGEV